jgi:hypothetical protein
MSLPVTVTAPRLASGAPPACPSRFTGGAAPRRLARPRPGSIRNVAGEFEWDETLYAGSGRLLDCGCGPGSLTLRGAGFRGPERMGGIAADVWRH